MFNPVEHVAKLAVPGNPTEGYKRLAQQLGVSLPAIYGFRKQRAFPLARARVIAEQYDIGLELLVR